MYMFMYIDTNMNTNLNIYILMYIYQSWASAFFYASHLRFCALGRSSSRWHFRALFWALNFALLRSRFRAPAHQNFLRFFFALLNFSRFFRAPRFFALVHLQSSIFALVIFCARTFTLLISFRATGFLSRSQFPFAHVCLYIL
jgi:hypothetical protein